jgi:hypothetical protein
LEATLNICQELDSKENRKHRKEIYLLTESISKLSPEQNDQIGLFCTSLNRLALLVNEGFADKKIVLKYYAHVILLSWQAIEPFVAHVRTTQFPLYLKEFEQLARYSQEYWRKNRRDIPLPNLPQVGYPNE